MQVYVAKQEVWKGRSLVADLSQLYSHTPHQIAAFIGKRTLVIPETCISDATGAEESRQGSRKQRLVKLHKVLRTLFYELGVGMKVVDAEKDSETSVPVPLFLDRGKEEWIAGVERRSKAARDWLVRIAKGVEIANREAWEVPMEGANPEDLEGMMDDEMLRWLRCWASEGRDESKGRLAEWMASLIRATDTSEKKSPYKRAEALVHAVRFIRQFGRRGDRTVPSDKKLIGNYHDTFYLNWAVRLRCQLWTADTALRNFCAMVKQVQRRLLKDSQRRRS